MRVGLVRSLTLGMVVVGIGLAGCDDNPTDFNDDETTTITTNPSAMTIPAGITTLLASRTENEGNEPTFEEITATVDASCGPGAVDVQTAATFEPSVQPPGQFDVTGGLTLGETCIQLQGGGVSATVEVTVVADSLEITGAPATIEPASGTTTAQLGASLLSDDGQAVGPFDPTMDLVWSSDDPSVLTVDETGLVTAVGPGTATITATWSENGATVTDQVTIQVLVPAPSITSSPATGGINQVITISGTGFIDGFHQFFVNGFEALPYVENQILNSTTAEFKMPVATVGSDVEITIGVPGDVSNAATVTVTANPEEPANDAPGTAPIVDFPVTEGGTVDGVDADDFYRFSLTETTMLEMTLDWPESGDMDLLVVDEAFTAFQCGFVTATASHPEEGTCTLGPGDYAFWVNSYDGTTGTYFLEVSVADN